MILISEEFMVIFVKIWIKNTNENRAICSIFMNEIQKINK